MHLFYFSYTAVLAGKDGILMKIKYMTAAVCMTAVLAFAGCGSSKATAEITPTPAATPTPTAVPETVTPIPTSTPAPRIIGTKTSQAKYIYLTNGLQANVREIYLKTSGSEEWGKNLIPSESQIKGAEQVQMFFTPASTSSASSEDSEKAAVLYDMKVVTSKGDAYQIYSIELSDMEKASLAFDQELSVAYLRYMSLSEKKEKDTKENSQQTSYSVSEDAYNTESGDYEESYYDSSYDESYDSSYDESYDSNYDSSADDSYDSGDDGSYDDGYDDSSDSGSTDTGSSDAGSDDGSYDDDSYTDEGDTDDSSSEDWDY